MLHHFFHYLKDSAYLGMIHDDGKLGNFFEVNKSACSLLGHTIDELKQFSLITLDAPAIDKKFQMDYLSQLDINGEVTFETIHLTKSGESIPMEVTAKVIYVEGKKYYSVVGKDIRERKRIEAIVRQNRQFESTLVESIPIPLFVKDINLRYSYCNQRFEEFLGRSKENLIGKTVYEISPSELSKKYNEADKSLLLSGGTQIYESQVKNNDGKLQDVIFYKTVFYSEDKNPLGIIGAILDITNLRGAEREKELLQAQLFHSSKLASIGTLAAGVAHEINNPLTIILAFAQVMQRKCKNNCEEGNPENLSKIIHAAERANVIVKSLNSFSRYDTVRLGAVDIHSCLNELLFIVKEIYEKDNVQIKADLNAQSFFVKANVGMVHQIFMNLLSNAKDACEKKDGMIKISTEDSIDGLVIKVSDNGHGIAPEILNRIFDPFFTTKEVGKGTGLGLSITHTMIQSFAAKISVESEISVGTTFKIVFPRI